MKKSSILIILIWGLSSGFSFDCTLTSDEIICGGTNLPEETMPVEQAKEFVLQRIADRVDRGFMERYPHLADIGWGPVVLVQRQDDYEGWGDEYYYVFYGVLSDGALAAACAIDAVSGHYGVGGPLPYSETNKMFFISPEQAKLYAAEQLGLDVNSLVVQATFNLDWSNKIYNRAFSWKYEVSQSDNRLIRAAGLDVPAVYIDPYTIGMKSEKPDKDNAGHPFFRLGRMFVLVDKEIEQKGNSSSETANISRERVFVEVE